METTNYNTVQKLQEKATKHHREDNKLIKNL